MRLPTQRSRAAHADALLLQPQVRPTSDELGTADVARRVDKSPAVRGQRRLKRTIDLIGAVVGLMLLTPFMAIVAWLIRRDSPGPALFKQERLGKGGAPFVFYKFRTMYDGNDSSLHRRYVSHLIKGDVDDELRGTNGALKIERDPRVTRVGRILRRTSLDELPQLINVVKGEMSLVGPRPPLRYEAEMYGPRHLRRLEVLPGMTGLWQIGGRTETSFDEMVALDVRYIDSWSVWLDIKILFKTIGVVLSRKGAW